MHGDTTAPKVSDSAPTSTRPRKILIVEDDTITRIALGDVLINDGDEVVSVGNGTELLECLEIISRNGLRAPDLIVMDVCMPGPSGVDVLRRLRKAGWGTPVVLMTCIATRDARETANEIGGAILLEKPFTLDELHLAARFAGWVCGPAWPHLGES
jgi:two-component system phosphate regulon response regulator OmpR